MSKKKQHKLKPYIVIFIVEGEKNHVHILARSKYAAETIVEDNYPVRIIDAHAERMTEEMIYENETIFYTEKAFNKMIRKAYAGSTQDISAGENEQ